MAVGVPPHSSCFWFVWDNTVHRFEWRATIWINATARNWSNISGRVICFLADKIYPNRSAVLTPYTSAQLARMPLVERRTYRKFNSLIRKYRIRVEHAIADLKTYKYVGSLWRHPMDMLPSTVCASLVCRRKVLFYENKCKPVDRPNP